MKRAFAYIIMLAAWQMAMSQQWVTFTTRPENVILTVDGTRIVLRDGRAEMLMQPGKHSYSAESPYYEPAADTFELKDTNRCDIMVVLQSEYAYMDVRSKGERDKIHLDQREIGEGRSVSSRVAEGMHRLTVIADTMCLYDGPVTVGKAEKKIVNIEELGVEPFRWDAARWLIPLSALNEDGTVDSVAMADAHAMVEIEQCGVNVTSNVQGATILIDGKECGNTPLVIPGLVANRKYLITLRMANYKEASATFQAESGQVGDVYIKMKKTK